MATNLSTFFANVPVGGLMSAIGSFDTTGTNYLKADGSDITASSYPAISPLLVPSTSSTLNGLPGTTLLQSVAYGNGIYVAVQATTVSGPTWVLVSTDGVVWNVTSSTPITGRFVNSIHFMNGKFYLAADGNSNQVHIYSSTDGIGWTLLQSITIGTSDLSRIWSFSYQNSVHFASVTLIGANVDNTSFHFLSSTDGITWTKRAFSSNVFQTNTSIAYGNSIYVAVFGSGQTETASDYTSSWTARTNTPTGGGGWSSVAFGNGIFVSAQGYTGAGTSFGSSTDGITWTQRTVPSGRYLKVIYEAGLFVAVGYSVAVTSPDGITWTARTVPAKNWQDVTYDATNGFVAVSTSHNAVITSTDGITWTEKSICGPVNWLDITYGTGSGYMAISDGGTVAASTDGITWTQKTTTGANGASIATNPSGSIYVARTVSTIQSSTDGTTWITRLTNTVVNGRARWCNDKFVSLWYSSAPASGAYYSEDGITWNACTGDIVGSTKRPSGVCYGNSIYVVTLQGVGTIGTSQNIETRTLLTSKNGMHWIYSHNMPAMALWSDVAYGNGVFVAISKKKTDQIGAGNADSASGIVGFLDSPNETGRICAVSTNGNSWIASALPIVGEWNSITFNGNIFIAVNGYGSNYAVSSDGINWSLKSTPLQGNWNGIVTGASNVSVAVSSGIPSTALKISESGTLVSLPYVKSFEGQNYYVRVK